MSERDVLWLAWTVYGVVAFGLALFMIREGKSSGVQLARPWPSIKYLAIVFVFAVLWGPITLVLSLVIFTTVVVMLLEAAGMAAATFAGWVTDPGEESEDEKIEALKKELIEAVQEFVADLEDEEEAEEEGLDPDESEDDEDEDE